MGAGCIISYSLLDLKHNFYKIAIFLKEKPSVFLSVHMKSLFPSSFLHKYNTKKARLEKMNYPARTPSPIK